MTTICVFVIGACPFVVLRSPIAWFESRSGVSSRYFTLLRFGDVEGR